MTLYEQVMQSVEYVRKQTKLQPTVAVVLGSGLGALADNLQDKVVIHYADIPHFPVSNVKGHSGNLVIGKTGNTVVAMMQGRFHYYEGYGMAKITYPVYVLKMLGVKDFVVTNACGGINRQLNVGDLMLITDYINLLGLNPLIGDNDERFGVRFPDMSEAYNKVLCDKARKCADKLGIAYKEGVYALFNGPCFETAAEIRAYERLGADAVGMSTVPETIVANYLGMRVLGISCITNMATGISTVKHSHEEVVRVANESSKKLCKWLDTLLKEW